MIIFQIVDVLHIRRLYYAKEKNVNDHIYNSKAFINVFFLQHYTAAIVKTKFKITICYYYKLHRKWYINSVVTSLLQYEINTLYIQNKYELL